MNTARMPCRRIILASLVLLCGASQAQAAMRPSGQRAARIRAKLATQVGRDPSVLTRPWFLRRAGLVKFKLPVTLRVREDGAPTAVADLGASLGSRTIALGGSLAAQVLFSDGYDGGALGEIGLEFVPSDTKFLRTSSIPLLWNTDVSDVATRADASLAPAGGLAQGCGDFMGAGAAGGTADPPGYNALFHDLAGELPGRPYFDPAGPGGLVVPAGYLPIYPGVDAVDRLQAGSVVGDNDRLGPSAQPFPANADVRDTVLRTNALQLQVARPGPAGGQPELVISRSGGQANLFGNIPGKAFGIDVTLHLTTAINAIERVVDQDVSGAALRSGDPYPAEVFQCRQLWTGAVRNYLPGIHLQGNLRIAPAITADGHLRIAKATVASPPNTPARVALSACLLPVSAYAAGNEDPQAFGFADATTAPPIPPASAASGLLPVGSDLLPLHADAVRYPAADVLGAGAPADVPCNGPADALLRRAAVGAPLDPLPGLAATNGSQVSVGGDITVNPVTVDVLIGDV
jgi:hypothetical protein